ncbi:LptE family protein [bacterium]|nr:LptE family protein [bacterium]
MVRGQGEEVKKTGWAKVKMGLLDLGLIALLILLFFQQHCGYHLVGQGISLPEYYWSMAIPVFENRTAQQDVAQIITLAIIDAFSQQGNLTIMPEEQANAILKGTITSYREQPQNISSGNLAQSYRIFITASVQLVNRKTGEIFWQDNKMYFSQDYEVSEQLSQTELLQIEAREQASADFADNLVSVVLEGF